MQNRVCVGSSFPNSFQVWFELEKGNTEVALLMGIVTSSSYRIFFPHRYSFARDEKCKKLRPVLYCIH